MNQNKIIIDFLKNLDGTIKENESLAPKTTFKIGSTADIFFLPHNIDSLTKAISFLYKNNFDYFLLGGGSNIVFPDHPLKKVVLSTEKLKEIKSEQSDDTETIFVTCQCGTTIASFINFTKTNYISGAEQFAGLPGTIGGACFMNARCFDKQISDILFSVSYFDIIEDQIKTTDINLSEWDYKKTPFQDNKKVILSATFKLIKKSQNEKELINEKCAFYISQRVDKGHFKYPSAGSVFKNNRDFGMPSGQIIDQAGLKGFSVGGASVAPFHGNFIINTNNATQNDIKNLVDHIKKIVYEKFNFSLECEIIFVDN